MKMALYVLEFDGSMEMYIHAERIVLRLLIKTKLNSKSITEPPVSYAEFSSTSKFDKQLQDNFCH